MILISHRGNISGPDPTQENNPSYISRALKEYDVEIDVWYKGGKWFLGHDEPQYVVDDSFLVNSRLWCHAKNIPALEQLLAMNVQCFWHQTDDVVLTNSGYLWTYPGKLLTPSSICVMPELASYTKEEVFSCAGVCSDYIFEYTNRGY